jgi:hypothetical protein
MAFGTVPLVIVSQVACLAPGSGTAARPDAAPFTRVGRVPGQLGVIKTVVSVVGALL